MRLDLIHDIQLAYRKVVDCMSRPGLISNLAEQAGKVDIDTGCFPSTVVLALMLLDTEVTFRVVSEREEEITKLLNQLTFAKASGTENADYIFVLHDALPEQLEIALEQAKTGDLINPHKSATLIVEVNEVTNEKGLVLKGPGIETENYVKVSTNGNWLDIRADKNSEYPLGIDMVFIAPNHNVLCLPRTTQILQEVV